jgi:hypothetical protein
MSLTSLHYWGQRINGEKLEGEGVVPHKQTAPYNTPNLLLFFQAAAKMGFRFFSSMQKIILCPRAPGRIL